MVANIKAIEVEGMIDGQRQLHLDEPILPVEPGRVRVIILVPESQDERREWLRAGAKNDAFAFLAEPEEDIYTLADGNAFRD